MRWIVTQLFAVYYSIYIFARLNIISSFTCYIAKSALMCGFTRRVRAAFRRSRPDRRHMNVVELPRTFASAGVASASMSSWDPDAECTVKIARPSDDDELWREYLAGAERSYRKHGVGAAIDVEAIREAGDTTVFWTMLDTTGTVLGGVRAVGPLASPDDSHAVVEWAGQPGLPQVRKMIADRLPFGVVEMKTAWVTDDRGRNKQLTTSLARTGCQ